MNWKQKALVQNVFSAVPGGGNLNLLCQRYLTRSLPTEQRRFTRNVCYATQHIDYVRRYGSRPLEGATFYEFGAGQELISPLVFYACGVSRQIVTDIRPLMRPELVNVTISRLQKLASALSLPRPPKPTFSPAKRGRFHTYIKDLYGIEYFAPRDPKETGFPTRSADYITSTNTLEHIPPHDIESILRECRRLLRDDGLVVFVVDYQDHYSYFDDRISRYNFLRYSDRAWSWLSPPLHYQNRLRHRDYLQMYEGAGFDILIDRPVDGDATDLRLLDFLPVDSRFHGYSRAELAVRGAWVILRKRRSS